MTASSQETAEDRDLIQIFKEARMPYLENPLRILLLAAGVIVSAALMPISGTESSAFAQQQVPIQCYQRAGDDCSATCTKECTDGSCCAWSYLNYP